MRNIIRINDGWLFTLDGDEVLSRIPGRSSFADLPVFSDRPDSISGKKYQQPCSETVSFPFPSTILLFVLLSSVFLFFSYYRNKFFLCYYSVIRSQSAISFFTICIIIPCSLTQFSDPFIQCTVSLLLFFIVYHLCKGLLVSHNCHTFSCSGNCGIKKVPV